MPLFICPHCNKANWAKAPGYHKTLLRLKKLGPATSSEIGRSTRNSKNQAHNELDYLADLGFVKKDTSVRPTVWTFIHD